MGGRGGREGVKLERNTRKVIKGLSLYHGSRGRCRFAWAVLQPTG